MGNEGCIIDIRQGKLVLLFVSVAYLLGIARYHSHF
jgi:hypothetical protein